MNDIPRRADLSRNTPAEIAIRKGVDEVEKMGASEALTSAIIKLSEARDIVSDVIDGVSK